MLKQRKNTNVVCKKKNREKKPIDLRVRRHDEMVFSFTYALTKLSKSLKTGKRDIGDKQLLKTLIEIEKGKDEATKKALEEAKKRVFEDRDVKILRELSARKVLFGVKK